MFSKTVLKNHILKIIFRSFSITQVQNSLYKFKDEKQLFWFIPHEKVHVYMQYKKKIQSILRIVFKNQSVFETHSLKNVLC